MKKLSLIFLGVMLLVGLVGCSGNGVLPPPSQEAEKFIGTWVNIDPNTNSITKIKIEKAGKLLAIGVWAKCEPEDCYWGEQTTDVEDAKDSILEIEWQLGFCIKQQELKFIENKLKVTTFTHFIDGSGRPDYELVNYFQK